jgi:hypothetical protein
MRTHRYGAVVLCAVAVLTLTKLTAGGHAVLRSSHRPDITPAVRAAGLRFDPTMAPSDRAWVLAAIRSARPEAQRLVDEVDGMVVVGSMPPQQRAIGLMMPLAPHHYEILLDVANLDGYEQSDRDTVVLHELGHVIDFALLDDSLRERMYNAIPRTGSCVSIAEPRGDCAAPRERFADTFAKWALRGAVSLVGAGYGVAAPVSLEDWGVPLSTLAASLPASR